MYPLKFPNIQGSTGAIGAIGAEVTTLYLATDQSVSDGGWIGLGTSSSRAAFTGSTVVIPTDATIVGMILNIRNNTSDDETPNCVGSTLGTAAVTTGTLLSVQLTASTGVGALSQGASVTIMFSL